MVINRLTNCEMHDQMKLHINKILDYQIMWNKKIETEQ